MRGLSTDIIMKNNYCIIYLNIFQVYIDHIILHLLCYTKPYNVLDRNFETPINLMLIIAFAHRQAR